VANSLSHKKKGRSGNDSKDQCANDGCNATGMSKWYYDKSLNVYVCLNCYSFLEDNNNHYPDYVSGKDKKRAKRKPRAKKQEP